MAARILVMVNKTWEAEPLLGVLRSEYGKPSKFPGELDPTKLPSVAILMSDGTTKNIPARKVLNTDNASCEIWWVKDLMDPKKSGSSSEEKARVLPYVIGAGAAPDIVIAFGTATLADPKSYNGSVAVGSKFFVFNPFQGSSGQVSNWTDPNFGKLLEDGQSSAAPNDALFTALDRAYRTEIESRFLSPPLNSAQPPVLLPLASSVALSNVNITNYYDDYAWADPEALRAFAQIVPKGFAGSVETTHGVIRIKVPASRNLFVSGIANRLGYFNMELAPRSYAQNFVASHNAGIVLAWMIPSLM